MSVRYQCGILSLNRSSLYYERVGLSEEDHRILGVEAIYPYLLRDVTIDRPDMAWATDITYIRLKHGFVYLVAVMDLFSRYIVSWKISNTLETAFLL